VQIQTDVPDPERLGGIIKIEVSRVRLEADPKWREFVDDLEATRNMRRIASAVYHHLLQPRDISYTHTAGSLRPRDLRGNLDLRFVFAADTAEDRYTFHLMLAPEGLHYEVKQAQKEFGEPWGGGVIPQPWKDIFIPIIAKNRDVWALSERMVRVIEPKEISWEWQPGWNLKNIPIPQSDDTLDKVFKNESDIPKFVVLASWGFTLDEHDWGANGNRIQLLIDPYKESVVHTWEDEWHVLY